LVQLMRPRWRPGERAVLAASVAGAGLVAGYLLARRVPLGFSSSRDLKLGAVMTAAGSIAVAMIAGWRRRRGLAPRRSFAMLTGVAATCTVWLLAEKTIAEIHPHPETESFAAAHDFAPMIPAGALLVSSGGPCGGVMAARSAYNQSYMFYWLDRKGFNVCIQEQSAQRLDSLARRGARAFVANGTRGWRDRMGGHCTSWIPRKAGTG
jgi:hypothetical protein